MIFLGFWRAVPVGIFAVCFFSSNSQAEPWVDVGDIHTRHHLQLLSDADLINLPLTTWPIMWRGVDREISTIDTSELTPTQLESYRHLSLKLSKAKRPIKGGQFSHLATSQYGIMDYADISRERLESSGSVAYHQGDWAFKLQGSVVGDTIDGQTYRADGSYIAGNWGNWAVGIGAINRWWGPSWQSSLILSNTARPTPGIFFSRIDSRAFDLPALKWLGPWDLRLFASQKEGAREISRAKLLGARVAFKPIQQVEIGLSRTAQWGGDGRPEDWVSFRRMLIGQSNRGADGLAEDGSDEPANQLGGYDWRWAQSFGNFTSAFYGQLIGEDEAGYLPYKFIGLAGYEISASWREAHHRFMLEVSNTTMEFNKGGTRNFTYEHPRYPSGYRYRGRPLGASTDNDSELITMKGFHYLPIGSSIGWTIGRARINVDGTQTYIAGGGNALADEAVSLWYATARYTRPLTDSSRIAVGGQFYSSPLEIRGKRISSGVSLSYDWLFGS